MAKEMPTKAKKPTSGSAKKEEPYKGPVRAEWRLNDAKTQATFSICKPDGTPLAHIDLTPDLTSGLIAGLGQMRAQMTPALHKTPISEGTKIDATIDPPWYVQPEPLTEGSAISIRHPAYGVLGFVIPRDEVEKIVRLLTKHLEMPQADRTKAH